MRQERRGGLRGEHERKGRRKKSDKEEKETGLERGERE